MHSRSVAISALFIAIATIIVCTVCTAASWCASKDSPKTGRMLLQPVGRPTADTPYSYFSKACATAYSNGDYLLAEKLCSDAIEDLKKQKVTDSRLAVALANLASVERQQRQYTVADKLFKKSLGVLKAQPKVDKACLQYIVKQYAGLLRKMERPSEASFILENPQAVLDSVAPAGALAGWAKEDSVVTPAPALGAGLQTNAGSGLTNDKQPSTEKNIKAIADHDVVVIIDKSRSMSFRDCPEGLSRWQWCAEQMRSLSREMTACFPHGITVVVFSDSFNVYRDTTIDRVGDIFAFNQPEGATKTDLALESQLDEYFSKRPLIDDKVKPLLIAVITDGVPDDPERLRDVIVDAENRMHKPREISITFLQVGNDLRAAFQLALLNQDLISHRPGYEIAHTLSFDELQRIGLLGGLAQAVTENKTTAGLK